MVSSGICIFKTAQLDTSKIDLGSTPDEIRKNQNSIIKKRIGILAFVFLSIWMVFSIFVYVRPIYWGYYTKIDASPFKLSKPTNETIFASPCIIEITEMYYNNFTCNLKNIVYTSKILSCPNNYYCSDLNNRKVCILNDTYYCRKEEEYATVCLNDISDTLGFTLQHIEILDVNPNTYTFVIILTSVYLILQIATIIIFYVSNKILYSKNYSLWKFHWSWFVAMSVTYFINLVTIPILSNTLIPNVNGYIECYDMDLIMLSRYSYQICFLMFVLIMGIGTLIYLAVSLSSFRYLRYNEEEAKLLNTKMDEEINLY